MYWPNIGQPILGPNIRPIFSQYIKYWPNSGCHLFGPNSGVKFRCALSNMRYGACTPEDLEFLHSRQIRKRPGHPTFEDTRFQNFSLITAWNSQKDQVNEMGCIKFAEETGQQRTCFYAEDSLAENTGSNDRASRANRKKNVVPPRKALTERQKMNLWDAPACTSDNIPGQLRLCVGLPVMIKPLSSV
jgi:hypothetical protein